MRHVRRSDAKPLQMVGPQYRPTFAERDRAKRRTRRIKKEEKRRTKEEQRMKSVWNLDNELRSDDNLDFR